MDVSELRKNAKVQLDGHPFIVVDFQFVKPGKGQGLYKCKLKNMITGAVLDRTWRSGESLVEANVESRKMQYLFKDQNGYTFMDTESYDQVRISSEALGDSVNYLIAEMTIRVEFYGTEPVGIELPPTVDLQVTDTVPAIKGATASAQLKPATLETGLVVQVPPFIAPGDKIRVNTETGEYQSRA